MPLVEEMTTAQIMFLLKSRMMVTEVELKTGEIMSSSGVNVRKTVSTKPIETRERLQKAGT